MHNKDRQGLGRNMAWGPYTCPAHHYSTSRSEGRAHASNSTRMTYFLTRNPYLQKVGHSITHSSHSSTHQERPQQGHGTPMGL